MELSNQKKLSEFYEELKRLNIPIIRPDINESFADFSSDGEKFYYALGAIKNVGFDAISNIIKDRSKNGKFKNLSDFINRVNPKDINKLQLEGLVQAGAFDNLNNNRHSLFNSIPSIILKSKNIHENKTANQINLFGELEDDQTNFLVNTSDWVIDKKLAKEFEILGFYISDHPLNQYKSIFNQYNIINYEDFETNNDILSSNVASTVLKVQEKKTLQGTTYGIVKFSDLSNVFELFIFSDIFEINRDLLIEGNSLMLTLIKNHKNNDKTQRRINVKNIISLQDVVNKPLKNIMLNFDNIDEIHKLKNLEKKNGDTVIKILINKNNEIFTFQLRDKRFVNNKLLNSLNLDKNLINE